MFTSIGSPSIDKFIGDKFDQNQLEPVGPIYLISVQKVIHKIQILELNNLHQYKDNRD